MVATTCTTKTNGLTPLPQQRGGGAGTVATAQQDTQPEMTALRSPSEASLQQQQTPFLQQLGCGAGTVATAQQNTQPEMTAPEASLQ
ncbi:uncharacterized protein LOC142775757 isoform X2 [Rhipicephalus microplus]|uniref:uncharacterized protein LOC142775757 isoform X2 n=1 Tax=Rhipicephalus microplus TaxID=6941 RepID=UPI003F6B0F85